MLDRYLVAVSANNIFIIISKIMSFYEKFRRTLFAFHKILYKKCSTQFLCKTSCYGEKNVQVTKKCEDSIMNFALCYLMKHPTKML